nr:zf-CCHC domain-containing protein/DUF4219 domain-containing protein/UBN2 domain-containing protein [Tanacetum cinerariifolium]
MMKEMPYKLQKKQLGKNNEATMTLCNALLRKEYEQVFMCKTAKEMMKEMPYELQKKQLGKNNEAKMTLCNALLRKEYEQVFMCKTAKEVWHTLIITHQGNLQVKNYKIDLLTQQYENFSISNKSQIFRSKLL